MIDKRNLLALCLLPSVAMAKDTIWLDNGDRIVGDIVFKTDDRLVVKTGYAGRVKIDWARVATLETQTPITVMIKGVEEASLSVLDVSENGTVICKKCSTQIVELQDIDTLVYPTLWNESLRTEGHLDLTADFERKDNDIDEYNIDSEVRLHHGRWRHDLDGEKERKSENDVTKEDRWDIKYSLDRFLGDHFYWRTSAELQRDHESDVFRARQYGAGPGYRLWDDELRRLDVSISYNHVHFWAHDAEQNENWEYGFNATQMSGDFRHALFGDRISFYAKADIAQPHIDVVELIIDAEFGFTHKITDLLSAKVSYEIDDIKTTMGDRRYYQSKVGLRASW